MNKGLFFTILGVSIFLEVILFPIFYGINIINGFILLSSWIIFILSWGIFGIVKVFSKKKDETKDKEKPKIRLSTTEANPIILKKLKEPPYCIIPDRSPIRTELKSVGEVGQSKTSIYRYDTIDNKKGRRITVITRLDNIDDMIVLINESEEEITNVMNSLADFPPQPNERKTTVQTSPTGLNVMTIEETQRRNYGLTMEDIKKIAETKSKENEI